MIAFGQRSGIRLMLFWITLAAVGSFFVLPLSRHLKFGIDLVGGFYITLKVRTDEAVKAELNDMMQNLSQSLKSDLDLEPKSKKIELHDGVFTFENINDATRASTYLRGKKEYSYVVHLEDVNVIVRLPEAHIQQIKNDAVENDIDVLRKRLDTTGTSEISVTRQGDDNIVVELPNVEDPAHAKQMIGTAAQLEV